MNCLFCRSVNVKKANFPRATRFNHKIFHYMQCRDCDLIFIDPVPAEEDYSSMYNPSYHDQFYFKDDGGLDYSNIYNLLEENISEKSLVDYGCGDGSLLRYFSTKGYRCIGVEYDKELVNVLRKKNPNITFLTIDEFWEQNQSGYSAIYMGDVLEHLSDPYQFLESLQARLRENGLILVQGPLENNFSLALLYRKSVSLFRFGRLANHTPYHISFSNASNQRKFFESKALKTLHYKVYETPWPFPERFSFNPVAAIKWLVARLSMLFSKALPGKAGNRFIYLGMVMKR